MDLLLESTDCFAQLTTQFSNSAWPKDKERKHQDKDQLRNSKITKQHHFLLFMRQHGIHAVRHKV